MPYSYFSTFTPNEAVNKCTSRHTAPHHRILLLDTDRMKILYTIHGNWCIEERSPFSADIAGHLG